MKIKKLLAGILAAAMTLALMTVPAFAAEGTGSITVKNATKGYEYNAYKVFDATIDGEAVSYKTSADNESLLDASLFGWSAADSEGNISVWALEDAAGADILAWVEANYASFGGTAIPGDFDATNSTVTFSDLEYGYYYITSGLGAAVTIDSAIPDAEVYDKNGSEEVPPEKTIVSVDGVEASDPKEADAHVGSVVSFLVSASTTNWIDQDTIRKEWGLEDTATNMFIDPESMVVKVNGEKISNYTAAGDGKGGFILNIPMVDENGNSIYEANHGGEAGQIPIEITYDAVILDTAAGEPAKNEIPDDVVVLYTYAFQVLKVDGQEEPLPGAQFELWADGAALTFIDNGDGTYTYFAGGDVTTLDMTENTTIVVKGLDNSWDYTLKETKVPDGYNQAADVDIAGSSLTKVTEDVDTSIASTDLFKETVVNNQGTELPSTGGMGTTMFYVIGAILMAGAGVVLVTRRRMAR